MRFHRTMYCQEIEVIDSITFGGADYAMTYEELASMFEAKNIDPEECERPSSKEEVSLASSILYLAV